MDLIDELLERDAGTVNSTIIGEWFDSWAEIQAKRTMYIGYVFLNGLSVNQWDVLERTNLKRTC